MAEQQPGLRFDIFERVHLAEEVDGIESLDEIELLPYIELSTQGQQTVLKGYLQLAGRYTNARNENEDARLEHRIPVNISMPSERIQNIEELGVEIDHFDIDLLSSRLLNVTGVLYLRGVEAAETRPSVPPQTEQEEMYFVHQANAQKTDETTDMRQDDQSEASEAPQFPEASAADSASAEPQQQAIQREEAAKQIQSQAEQSKSNISADAPQNAASNPANAPSNPASAADASADSLSNASFDAADEAELQQAEQHVQPEAAPEMKIAFSGKQTASNDLMNAAEFQSMLQKGQGQLVAADSTEKELEAQEHADREDANNSAQKTASDQVQWKNLFLPKEEDEVQQFRKVRMCIVQREETLDSIAERYSLNPREILLYNRLGEQQEVTEGQVIYIPKT